MKKDVTAKATTLSLDKNMLELLRAYRLDEVLDSLSRKCLTHAKELLNQEKAEDDNGNTLRVLIEFNQRIVYLVRSAKRKNARVPDEERESGRFKVRSDRPSYKEWKKVKEEERGVRFKKEDEDLEEE